MSEIKNGIDISPNAMGVPQSPSPKLANPPNEQYTLIMRAHLSRLEAGVTLNWEARLVCRRSKEARIRRRRSRAEVCLNSVSGNG